MATATVSTATVPITTVEHPLRNPNYRLWLIGGTISLLDSWMWQQRLGTYLLDLRGFSFRSSEFRVGLVKPIEVHVCTPDQHMTHRAA